MAVLSLCVSILDTKAETTFTYQGRFNDGDAPANGVYQMTFRLFDAASGPQQLGGFTFFGIVVSNGLFNVALDYGPDVFDGGPRWLEIAVRTNGSTAAFTTLAPRQPITASPYSIVAEKVIGPVPDSQLSLNIPRLNAPATFSGALSAAYFSGNGSGLTSVNASSLQGFASQDFWKLLGNSGTTAGTHFLGTADNQPLELKVNGMRALRLEPTTNGSPNVIAGSSGNVIAPGISGATIGGGDGNRIEGGSQGASILGGASNIVSSRHSTIGGGERNSLGEGCRYAIIGGGQGNELGTGCHNSTIAGGDGNRIEALASASAIGGGADNRISRSSFSTIGGGTGNQVSGEAYSSTIGGGSGNVVGGFSGGATIAGGEENIMGGQTQRSTIAGGGENSIQVFSAQSTISGGSGNLIGASSRNSTIGGGVGNTMEGGTPACTIGGGNENTIDRGNSESTIAGGALNAIGGTSSSSPFIGSTISGGVANSNYGSYATIPGGRSNHAAAHAFAAGTAARATNEGSFVWSDSTGGGIGSTASNQFTALASGGVRFFTDAASTTGAELAPGSGSWSSLSDRNSKTNLAAVKPSYILERLATLAIHQWNYKAQNPGVRHIGPTAQDFRAAFGVGEDERRISSVDADGVALAAIQGLHALVQEKDKELQALKARLATIEVRLGVNSQ